MHRADKRGSFGSSGFLGNGKVTWPGQLVKKDDDLEDVLREERSRGRKRPVDTEAISERAQRRDVVLRILRRGTREDLRALLKVWGYSGQEIEAALKEYDAAFDQQSS